MFNSVAIEVHLNKIPGLAERFVYFCDDMYLMKPCKQTDFFRRGKPADMVRLGQIPVNQADKGETYYCHLYNNYSIYRQHFTKKMIFRNFWKFANLKYGRACFTNILNLAASNLYIKQFHHGIPLLKTSMDVLWREHEDFMTMTAESKFRICENVNLEAARCYQLITGNFIPTKKTCEVFASSDPKTASDAIESGKYKYLCISDNSTDDHFETDKELINRSFDKAFPQKCSFEL